MLPGISAEPVKFRNVICIYHMHPRSFTDRFRSHPSRRARVSKKGTAPDWRLIKEGGTLRSRTFFIAISGSRVPFGHASAQQLPSGTVHQGETCCLPFGQIFFVTHLFSGFGVKRWHLSKAILCHVFNIAVIICHGNVSSVANESRPMFMF